MRRKRIKDLALQNQAKSGRIRNKSTTRNHRQNVKRNRKARDSRAISTRTQTVSGDTDARMADHRSIHIDTAGRYAEPYLPTLMMVAESLREGTEHRNRHVCSSGLVDIRGEFLGGVCGLDRQAVECDAKDHEALADR